MIVFLRRIPADTNKYEILHFIRPALRSHIFSKKGEIKNIKVFAITDTEKNTVEYHGLVRIEPEAVAEKVIKKLNRQTINGKNIAVREYHLRNWHNDPRLKLKNARLSFPDRRKADRRRKKIRVEEVGAIAEAAQSS